MTSIGTPAAGLEPDVAANAPGWERALAIRQPSGGAQPVIARGRGALENREGTAIDSFLSCSIRASRPVEPIPTAAAARQAGEEPDAEPTDDVELGGWPLSNVCRTRGFGVVAARA